MKLTDAQKQVILHAFNGGASMDYIARTNQVSFLNVRKVCYGSLKSRFKIEIEGSKSDAIYEKYERRSKRGGLDSSHRYAVGVV